MFEVNLFTPGMHEFPINKLKNNTKAFLEQFGAFIPWLVIHRGPLSAMVHPNTGDELRDHTQRVTWLGAPWPVNSRRFHLSNEKQNAG
jgi:aromatic ring-cleaving dioxygenase